MFSYLFTQMDTKITRLEIQAMAEEMLRKGVSLVIVNDLIRFAPEYEGLKDLMEMWMEEDEIERSLTMDSIVQSLRDITSNRR